jgi:hypothetical protein
MTCSDSTDARAKATTLDAASLASSHQNPAGSKSFSQRAGVSA